MICALAAAEVRHGWRVGDRRGAVATIARPLAGCRQRDGLHPRRAGASWSTPCRSAARLWHAALAAAKK